MAAATSIKLLERLELLERDWAVAHAKGTRIIASLANLHQQRRRTLEFHQAPRGAGVHRPPVPSSRRSAPSSEHTGGNGNGDDSSGKREDDRGGQPPAWSTVQAGPTHRMHLELDTARNAAVSPAFLELFPGVMDRLLVKQTLALERTLGMLADVVSDDMHAVVAAMGVLARDAVAKAGPMAIAGAGEASTVSGGGGSGGGCASSKSAKHKQEHAEPPPQVPAIVARLLIDPAEIPVFLAASWIDAVATMYQRELFVREDLLAEVDLGTAADATSRGAEWLQAQWEATTWLDKDFEEMVHDRLRIAQQSQ
ncbi:hypothetical protein HK105_206525 [Polyrhizophydium stewartii]|uniref:Uncharacterized protein n=1 Tax=Polyrhizophydium stewartii TaxID=2732419 RepID=A0ABR4N365_9FUNG|nr:hypothetical protein HK105_004798 [Polyrhizophydium stewartii]